MNNLFREHIRKEVLGPLNGGILSDILFLNKKEAKCASFFKNGNIVHMECSYYVGADWFPHLKNEWFYVESKLNTRFDQETGEEIYSAEDEKKLVQIDVLNMLFQALQEPETRDHTKDLFEVKFESKWIPLTRSQDLLSPLIMIQFLNVIKEIVRRGLKNNYNKVQENLYAKVKGKVLVGQTIKQNQVKNKNLNTICQYKQYEVNGLENRILKKTLVFIKRYLATFRGLASDPYFQEIFNYIQPAFENVSDEVSIYEIKHLKFNPFYKNYKTAIELSKLILKRFSYNLNTIQNQETILTPPYWIDMSKLFELYVMSKLKEKFRNECRLEYQFGNRANQLDFLLDSGRFKMVIDSKYKAKYSYHFVTEDIRQISGYARLKKVHEFFGLTEGTLIDCLIIYPDPINGYDEIPDNLDEVSVNDYYGIYKLGIKIPELRQ